jgi:acetolactate synthase small subunit|tara:strand:- start:340 stop:570 length:231 start_codon:yes stop_codon:yes gene_type:complete
MENKTVKVTIKDSVGALPRVIQIFARRGFAIEEIHAISKENNKEVTIVFPADDYIKKIVLGQLNKLNDSIEVIEVQ